MRALFTIPLGILSISLNTVVHVGPLYAVALLKLVPVPRWRRVCSRVLAAIAESWIAVNSALFPLLTRTRWRVELPEGLSREGSYLVVCNHRSWVDIPVLQRVFNRRIPLLRFFLKRELAWVPLLGQAWWALDFPFMRRHSREEIARRPELRGRDREATRRACRRLDGLPVSIMNFVEGTRFSEAKAGGSAATGLLPPKAGGVGFVFDAMPGRIEAVIDVTIAYRPAKPSLVDLLADRVEAVAVHARRLPVPAALAAGEGADADAWREALRDWIGAIWADKAATLARLQRELGAA